MTNFLHDKSQEYFEQSAKKSMKKAFLEEEIYWIQFKKGSRPSLGHPRNPVSSPDIKDSMIKRIPKSENKFFKMASFFYFYDYLAAFDPFL